MTSTMNKVLIDTNIFIDHFRGYKPAGSFLVKIFNGDYNPLISTLTEMELFAGLLITDSDAADIDNLLNKFEIVAINSTTSRMAGKMLSRHRRQGLTPVDALIAASAISADAILVTRNVKHFSLVDNLLTLQPY